MCIHTRTYICTIHAECLNEQDAVLCNYVYINLIHLAKKCSWHSPQETIHMYILAICVACAELVEGINNFL